LQAAVTNANAFHRWLAASPPNLDRAKQSANRGIRHVDAAAEVVSRIRALFTQPGHSRQLIELNGVVKEVCDVIADKLQANNIRLELDLDPSLPSTVADRVQIEQVVVNLVRNAIEAMQDAPAQSRILRIATRLSAEDMLEVEVSDTFAGIPDPEKIFDAFFTTKKDGIGMGLAICRSVAEAHGGRVWADRTTEAGASFTFSLPAYSPDRNRGRQTAPHS
jgi:signal transduction histidine kinase